MIKKILVECPPCDGTGLYSGYLEARGEPTVCIECNGTGAITVEYTPFTGRKPYKKSVKCIRQSGGVKMSYAEFKKKFVPPKVK